MTKEKLSIDEIIYTFIDEKLKIEDEITRGLLYGALYPLCEKIYELGIEHGYLVAGQLDDLIG